MCAQIFIVHVMMCSDFINEVDGYNSIHSRFTEKRKLSPIAYTEQKLLTANF